MNPLPSRPEPHRTTAHVWAHLATEQQQRAIRLLAQLAYAQYQRPAPQSRKEKQHVSSSPDYQDSP